MLVETLAGDFDPDEFEDDYRAAVEALVQAKVEGGEVERPPVAAKSSGEVVDLLAALQRSVDAAKSARGEATGADVRAEAAQDEAAEDTEDTEEASGKGAPKKTARKASTTKKASGKSAAKKSAKKTAAKKTPAKKAAAKKSARKAS
jgi:DNA end-binding protein Ku